MGDALSPHSSPPPPLSLSLFFVKVLVRRPWRGHSAATLGVGSNYYSHYYYYSRSKQPLDARRDFRLLSRSRL